MQKSDELVQAYYRFLDAVNRGNLEALDAMVSRDADVSVIGTDPNEWWMGHDSAVQALRSQSGDVGNSASMVAGSTVEAYVDGNFGWVTDRPLLVLPGGEMACRVTMLFHREDGAWRMLQSHASFGVRNEDVLGVQLAA
jgi:ketosteroid isomerase-like protein